VRPAGRELYIRDEKIDCSDELVRRAHGRRIETVYRRKAPD